jgi:hypothetical protein
VAAAVVLDLFNQRFRSQQQFLATLLVVPPLLAVADSLTPKGRSAESPVMVALAGAVVCIVLATVS